MVKKIKASMTMEAAIIIPIFVIVVMGFVSMMHIIYIQMCVQSAVGYAASSIQSKGVIYEYIYDGIKSKVDETKNDMETLIVSNIEELDNDLFKEALDWSVQQLVDIGEDKVFDVIVKKEVNSCLNNIDADFSCIVGEKLGVKYTKSKVINDDGEFIIVAEYKVKIPILFSKSINFDVTQCVKARTFGGNLPALSNIDKKDKENDKTDSVKVYVTEYGEVYHKDKNCVYLTNRMMKVVIGEMKDKRNNSGAKYYSCERCGKSLVLGYSGYVYYSQAGKRYHSTLDCPAIARTIKEIGVSKIENRRECKKCGSN